ncbi:MAG: laccase domain-containing protein [Lachnospiraceae bacterium]|nr:laccase domain-containing protein [Lachnospiraceae bacterium]
MEFVSVPEFDRTGLVKTFSTTKDEFGWRNTPERDLICYRRVLSRYGLSEDRIVGFNLAHTSNVFAVTGENGGEGVFYPSDKGDYDGIITNEKGLMLTTIAADCAPVFLLDPVRRAIGMIHSGWRGTAGEISKKALILMQDSYGTDPADVMAAIGPCICGKCYEVSDDLRAEFSKNFSEEETEMIFTPVREGHSLLDLAMAISLSLTRAGVRKENVILPRHCTLHGGRFYSWRGQQKKGEPKNDFLSGIMLV